MNHKTLIFLLFFPISAWCGALPDASMVPGGIAIIDVGANNLPAPRVEYNNNRVLVYKNPTQWTALVGIPLSAKPGKHSIAVATADGIKNLTFEVIGKDYPAQYITIKNKRMVNPNPDDLKRIKGDRTPIRNALNTWTEQEHIDMDFIAPVDGRLSSLFGLKRFFNKQPRNPHSGLDIAARTGTPIVSPAPAKVIDTGDFYFNGKTVFLDHGQGLISGYFHMSDITVQPGQNVDRGQVIGAVGATGRVTGPHLHWNIYLNGNKVDPALFISQFIPALDAQNKKP